MIKKIVLGTVLVGLCGVLVVGAINRTTAKATRSEQVYGQGDRRGSTETISDAGKQLRGSLESGGNTRRSTAQDSDCNPIADHIFVPEWEVLQGIVANVDEDALTVRLLSGEQIVVEERAWSFAQEQGFSPQVGDQVTLAGFFEGEEFEAGRIENLTAGQIVALSGPDGRPQWAGRGRRGG